MEDEEDLTSEEKEAAALMQREARRQRGEDTEDEYEIAEEKGASKSTSNHLSFLNDLLMIC